MNEGHAAKSVLSSAHPDLALSGRSFCVSHVDAFETTAPARSTCVFPPRYLTLTPLASPPSTRISSTWAPSLSFPPYFLRPWPTSASAIAWEPPTGKSSSQLGWYHSLNMKATSAAIVPPASWPLRRKHSRSNQLTMNSSFTTPLTRSRKDPVRPRAAGERDPKALGRYLPAVRTTPGSLLKDAGGRATDAFASGSMNCCRARHSLTAASPLNSLSTSMNCFAPTSVRKLPSGRWHIQFLYLWHGRSMSSAANTCPRGLVEFFPVIPEYREGPLSKW
mmetsp:Transcript_11463/g.34871  ORF Transcript_11463/g.34871 Transcript_11463/m.34871 type:complete len:277 (+) Transcript_11463:565-1395(+)